MKAAIFSRTGDRLCEAPACKLPTPLRPFESESGADSIALCLVHAHQLAAWIDGDEDRERWTPAAGFHGAYYNAASVLLGRREP